MNKTDKTNWPSKSFWKNKLYKTKGKQKKSRAKDGNAQFVSAK